MNGDETDDLKFLFAGRRGDLDFVADLAIEESTADGRSGGDKALVGVGFLAADELVFDFDVALSVQNDDAGAVAGTILGNVGEIEHAEIAHALFELADAGVHEALSLFGELVFGIFREIAVSASDGNFLGKLDVEFVFELVDFRLELLFDFRNRVRHKSQQKKIRGGGIKPEPPPR